MTTLPINSWKYSIGNFIPNPDRIDPIGMGVTHHIGGDKYPFTIVDLTESGKTLYVNQDIPTIISGDFENNNAIIDYKFNSCQIIIKKLTFRKDGVYRESGTRTSKTDYYTVGKREYYLDPNF